MARAPRIAHHSPRVNDPRARLADNPFYVLGVRPGATPKEIEREGQKLLGMLGLGLSSAKTYETPVGRFERTEEKLRAAMNELRDPEKRALAEIWARLDPRSRLDEPRSTAPEDDRRWPEALAALGFGGGRT